MLLSNYKNSFSVRTKSFWLPTFCQRFKRQGMNMTNSNQGAKGSLLHVRAQSISRLPDTNIKECKNALQIVVRCCPLFFIVVHCCQSVSIDIHCYPLLSIVVHFCPMLPIVVIDCGYHIHNLQHFLPPHLMMDGMEISAGTSSLRMLCGANKRHIWLQSAGCCKTLPSNLPEADCSIFTRLSSSVGRRHVLLPLILPP